MNPAAMLLRQRMSSCGWRGCRVSGMAMLESPDSGSVYKHPLNGPDHRHLAVATIGTESDRALIGVPWTSAAGSVDGEPVSIASTRELQLGGWRATVPLLRGPARDLLLLGMLRRRRLPRRQTVEDTLQIAGGDVAAGPGRVRQYWKRSRGAADRRRCASIFAGVASVATFLRGRCAR